MGAEQVTAIQEALAANIEDQKQEIDTLKLQLDTLQKRLEVTE